MANRLKQEILAQTKARTQEVFKEFFEMGNLPDITVGSEVVDEALVKSSLDKALTLLEQLSVQDLLALSIVMSAFADVGDEITPGAENPGLLFEQVDPQ